MKALILACLQCLRTQKKDRALLQDEAADSWWSADYLGKSLVAIGLTVTMIYAFLVRMEYIELDGEVWIPEELNEMLWVLFVFGTINTAVFVWRLYLVITYRSIPMTSRKNLPKVTVVVPAYNEGRLVMDTLESIAASDYPRKKLQVIAVDDGSKDDTWQWMQAAAAKLGGRVDLVRLPANKGKRRALYEGFRRATGQVLVTIDSDSLVERQTLRHLVAPFVRDVRCGAVAGNVRVLNRKAGLIPRMLEVTFNYSFDFMRASQSRFNTVFCTPGALSAYKSELVMKVLDNWLGQKFLGEPAGIGEDRAMTNLILKQGYHVLFQRHAVVHTKVPVTYKGLCKMYLRWARSNVRETVEMAKFAFRPFRPTSALGARIELARSILSMSLGEVAKVIATVLLIANLEILLPGFMVACCFSAIVPAAFFLLRHKDSDFLWAFVYAIYSAVGLTWISLYAIFTVKRSAWLTRELPAHMAPLPAIQAPVQVEAQPSKKRFDG
jgi:hyaluronan synthase